MMTTTTCTATIRILLFFGTIIILLLLQYHDWSEKTTIPRTVTAFTIVSQQQQQQQQHTVGKLVQHSYTSSSSSKSMMIDVSTTNNNNNDDDGNFVFDDCSSSTSSSRRTFVRNNVVTMMTLVAAVSTSSPTITQAAVVDATDIFADNDWMTSSSSSSSSTSTTKSKSNYEYQPTDEVVIKVNQQILQQQYNGILGIEIVDIEYRTNLRVRVKSIQPNSYAELLHIQPNWIIVSINDINTERTNAAGVRQYLYNAIQNNKDKNNDIVIVFRDPNSFQSQLRDMSSSLTTPTTTTNNNNINNDEVPTVTTQIAPMGDTTQRNKDGSVKIGQSITTATNDQRITIQQLVSPNKAICTRQTNIDDLLEISYTGTVVETGQLFDGSAILIDNVGIPGRGNDITIFFVLGKQPMGQFPPGWDIGLMNMCVGERRRIILPPLLAYGSKGLPRRSIPPNATLQYDVTLISINGLATP